MHRYDWTFTIQLLQKKFQKCAISHIKYLQQHKLPLYLSIRIVYNIHTHKVTTVMHFKDEFTAIIHYPGSLGGGDNITHS